MSTDGTTTPPSMKENYELNVLSNDELNTSSMNVVQVVPPVPPATLTEKQPPVAKRDGRFWMCFVAIMLATFLVAMDIVSVLCSILVIILSENFQGWRSGRCAPDYCARLEWRGVWMGRLRLLTRIHCILAIKRWPCWGISYSIIFVRSYWDFGLR